mgnify:CR=1 FL=1
MLFGFNTQMRHNISNLEYCSLIKGIQETCSYVILLRDDIVICGELPLIRQQ